MHNLDVVKVAKVIEEQVDGNNYCTKFSLKFFLDYEYYYYDFMIVKQKIVNEYTLESYYNAVSEAKDLFSYYDPADDDNFLNYLFETFGYDELLDAEIELVKEV